MDFYSVIGVRQGALLSCAYGLTTEQDRCFFRRAIEAAK